MLTYLITVDSIKCFHMNKYKPLNMVVFGLNFIKLIIHSKFICNELLTQAINL